MVRGIEKRAIFLDDRDRRSYLEKLAECVLDGGATCYAWALMPNHVHLVVRTGDEPISKIMQRVGTSHAVRFNRRHERVGHLFQNRFRSQLVLDDDYLIPLIRYVLRNPLAAGIVRSLVELERHPWTAYGAILGTRPACFEAVSDVLRMFAPEPRQARQRLRAYMREEAEPAAADDAFEPEADPPSAEGDSVVPAERTARAAPTEASRALDRVIRASCKVLRTSPSSLRLARRDPRSVRTRDVIAYVATRVFRIPVTLTARQLRVSHQALRKAVLRAPADVANRVVRELERDGRRLRREDKDRPGD